MTAIPTSVGAFVGTGAAVVAVMPLEFDEVGTLTYPPGGLDTYQSGPRNRGNEHLPSANHSTVQSRQIPAKHIEIRIPRLELSDGNFCLRGLDDTKASIVCLDDSDITLQR